MKFKLILLPAILLLVGCDMKWQEKIDPPAYTPPENEYDRSPSFPCQHYERQRVFKKLHG